MQRCRRSLWGCLPPSHMLPGGHESLRTWSWGAEMGGGRVMLDQWSFWGGPPAMRRNFYKPIARRSLVLIVAPTELVGEEANRLLGELGEVDDARDDQGGEQQRQHHAPRRGQGIVAPGLGAEAPSGFHVPGHFPVPCLQQPRDGAAVPGLPAAPSLCLPPALLRGFGPLAACNLIRTGSTWSCSPLAPLSLPLGLSLLHLSEPHWLQLLLAPVFPPWSSPAGAAPARWQVEGPGASWPPNTL